MPGTSFDPLVGGTGYVQPCLTVGGTEEGFDSVMEYATVHA